MNQQPDKLFNEKLGNHLLPAPSATWDKIEARINRKSTKWIWAAAATLLLLVVASIVFLKTPDHLENTVADKTIKQVPEMPKPPVSDEALSDRNKRSSESPQPLPAKETVSKALNDNNVQKQKDYTENKSEKQPIENPKAIEEEIVISEIILDEPQVALVEEVSDNTDNNIKLVLEADDVNKKYLADYSLTQATPDEKKSSKLRKLLNKAYDLKTNQDPFGELRQMKNEILALNLKNEKRN